LKEVMGKMWEVDVWDRESNCEISNGMINTMRMRGDEHGAKRFWKNRK